MIVVLGSVVAHAQHFDEVLSISYEHVLRSRAEPGCIAHAVHLDSENPLRLVFVEQWTDQTMLWQHFAVPAARAFGRRLAALASAPPIINIFEATPVAVPARSGR
ncbi:MAG: putative quinol monooxygenase [Burkholderiaceae bacterium]